MSDHSHLKFRKSSYSSARQENCVEVADAPGYSVVRDTQHRHLGALAFDRAEWSAFIDAVRSDEI